MTPRPPQPAEPGFDRVAPEDRREDIDAIVQHTDSGDGTSQREHWPPNVSGPQD